MNGAKLKKAVLWSCLAVLVVCAVLWLVVSRSAHPEAPEEPERTKGGLPVIAPVELKVTPSKEGVAEFLEKSGDYASVYGGDACYNITPDFVADNSDFTIFKVGLGEKYFVMYGGEVYPLYWGLGAQDPISMALADVDQDGWYELYYSYIYGSGILRCGISYFDPHRKESVSLGRSFQWDKLFTTNEAGELCVNELDWEWNDPNDEGDFDAEYSICAGEQIGTILFEDGEITLKTDPEYEDDMW